MKNHLLKTHIILSVCLSFTLLVLTDCTKPRTYKIGVSQCSQDDWRMKLNDEIRREMMFHEDAEVEIRSANDNNERQIADIRYFADNGFDAIIVSPNEAAALTPVISDVHAQGIPVIIFDRNILGDTYTARIGVDDEGLGRSAAHYALHLLGPGAKAIEIFGRRGSTPAEGRHNGFTREFEAGGGTLLASETANWNKEEAAPLVDSLLQVYPDVDLIYAHNDRMAIGASEVATLLGRRDGIKIIGIDAAPDIGIRAVADSVIDATFLYPTEGQRLIRTALAILKGQPYERETILPVSSAVDLTNADILLLQDRGLKEETGKMQILKKRIDDYWAQHSSQTSLFYASIAIIALLFGVIFLVLRTYWQHKRHQRELMVRNSMLEEERDKQFELNEQLKAERDKQCELNNQLEAATQSKLTFFTNVSHDLRTPLTLIAEPVAQLTAAGNLTDKQQTLMKIADKNVRILRRLIDQILDFRKYENNKLALHLSEIPLGKAVEEWVESFRALAQKRGMKLTLNIAADSRDMTVAVDAEKIERVFFNLLSNAFKYTPSGGSIAVNYSVDVQEGNIVLSVADTGFGISERDLGNIFDRFYQVDRVHPNGSGIGLSLTKAFVELHQGKISVESALNEGSVFTVTLPLRHTDITTNAPLKNIRTEEVEAELNDIETEVIYDQSKPLVLIIDDNKDIRQLLSELLGNDYNVIAASNGQQGISRAVKNVPDLIICDVMMPGMDGLECCRRLKEEVTTSHIPVLMLTACSRDEQRVQGFGSGADGYLSKPFSSSVLLAQCASLIANRRLIKQLWEKSDVIRRPSSDKTPKQSATPRPVSEIDSEFYNRFLHIFESEISNSELSVETIAAKMGLERTQFYRKIKALTNFSPVELIRNLRLRHARTLIKTTELSVSEIAYQTGFSTPTYFSKCYRDAYSETPSETRSKLTGS